MTSAEKKALWRIYEKRSLVALYNYLITKGKKHTKPSTKKRREKKKASRKELVQSVRPIVVARADGGCEACGLGTGPLEFDEFYGRRPADVTVEKTWMLCRYCHGEKTRNSPSRAHWDLEFEIHCRRHGYRFRRRLTKDIRAPRAEGALKEEKRTSHVG